MRVLLLEDDRETAEALEKGLGRTGHDVTVAWDVPTALARIEGQRFEVAVLDVMVPGGSGYDVVAALRAAQPQTQILMLTAKGSVEERVRGLDEGADDYLVKPFSFAELVARLRACERRHEKQATELEFDALELQLTSQTARVGGRAVDLTPTEFRILVALVRAHCEPVGRIELLRDVWEYDFDPGTNIVEVHVNRLRRKLENAGLPNLIRTVRGQGYAVEASARP